MLKTKRSNYGGFNKIQFFKNKTKVVQLILKKPNKLNENLLLIYTGIQRNAKITPLIT